MMNVLAHVCCTDVCWLRDFSSWLEENIKVVLFMELK